MKNELRIKYLEAEIERHNALYYAGNEEISDDAFDALRDELEELHPDSKVLPKVGAEVEDSEWEKASHSIPMGSLAKVNKPEEFEAWVTKTVAEKFMFQEKLDGLSVDVIYVDGVFTQGITRGDGFEGEDITRNVAKMGNVPKRIPVGGTVSLRGEMIIPLDVFAAKYDLKNGGEFKNARNGAGGLARRRSGEGAEDLVVKYFDVVGDDNSNTLFKTEEDKIAYIETRLGLEVVTYFVPLTVEMALKVYEKYHVEIRDQLNWEIDGMVAKCNDLQTQDALGTTTDNRPRGQVAFKFASRKKVTYLEDVIWEVGNTGRLTPVAIVEPTELSGVTVRRVTLHNADEFEKHELYRGVPVLISRAGDVIPYFHGVVEGMDPKDPEDVGVRDFTTDKAPVPVIAAPPQAAFWDAD